MSLVAAFRTRKNGVLLCADKEEDDGVLKNPVDKIYHFLVHQCEIFVAGSGPSAVISVTHSKIDEHLKSADAAGVNVIFEHRALLKECLDSIYQDYQEELTACPMGLIIVVAPILPGTVPMVYATEGRVLAPSGPYIAKGSGKLISDYLANRLYRQEHGNDVLALVAAFILREAEKAVSGVGLGADMVFIHDGDKSRRILYPDSVRELQAGIPKLEDAVYSYWKDHATVPAWLTK